MELPQQLPPPPGFCSACSSANGRLGGAMFGEGLVLVTSGDISCFRHSGRACGGSEAAGARTDGGTAGWDGVEVETDDENLG